MVSEEMVSEYAERGVLMLPGVFASWCALLRDGVEANLRQPGPNASEHVKTADAGRFFEEYLSWDRIEQYRRFIFDSPVGAIGAKLMCSSKCQLFADHVFVKEPGTRLRTTWHQDAPYSPFTGLQSINAWIALDAIARRDALHFVPGSHLWDLTLTTRSFDDGQPYEGSIGTDPGSIDVESYPRVAWDLLPGDALFFDSRILHGTSEDAPLVTRRRAFCVRMVGDDVRYAEKPGIPPFPWKGLVPGQRLPRESFPVLYPLSAAH